MESTKRTTRRVLAILMAIAMVFGMITPQIAYAIGDDELSGAPAAEQPQEVVNDTPEPADADPEPPAPAKAGEEGPDRGGESGEEFSWVDTYGAPCEPKADFTLFLKWLGDQYYLPGGRFYEEIGGPKLQVGIVGPLEPDPAQPADENYVYYHAGDTIKYRVTYVFDGAESFSDDPYYYPTKLFDDYEDITFKIKLPEGVSIAQSDLAIVGDPAPYTDPDTGEKYNIYTLQYNETNTLEAGQSKQDGFTFQLYIGGNGTDDAINTYDFPDDMVSLYANWTVVNKYDEPNEDANTYELTVTNTTKDLKTVSPDNWGVEKLPFGEPQLDKTNNTVTFKWKVNVGMIDPNSTPENKVLLTADPVYYGHGRDAVTSFTLGELITANYINNGALTPLHPDGGTISISKSSTGANSYELSLTADAGSIVVWPADSATSSDLVMNSVQVDADGDGLKDSDPYVPAYTTYYVTAVYKYTPDMIGQFTEPARQISAKNKVSSTAVLPNKDNQTDNAENTQNRALFVDDPASFIITKDLKLKNGTTVNYAGENKKYGDLGFTITDAAGNPVTIYSRSGNADDGYTYEPYTGDLEQTTNLTQPKVYYVLPGVTYKITETIDSRYTDYMEPAAAGGETVTKGPLSSGGQPVDFRFTNKETIGSITVKKEDTAGHPVKGAKFKLVSVGENGTETQVGEILETEGTNTATCTWNDLPYGTYKLYEVESAPGYVKMDAENGLPLTITIPYTDENNVVHVDYTTPVLKNKKTQATVTLHKYVGANGALSTFNRLEETVVGATYLLERSSDGGRTWESAKTYDGTVITAKPLSSFGFLEYNVPASENDVTYTYRWKETLSNNDTYIPVNHPENDTKTGYSDTFTMTEGDSKTSIIYNRTLTKIKVQKEGKQYDTKGAFGYITDIEVPVTLYRYSGTGTPTSVSQLEDLGTQTAKYNDNNATWDKLPWYTGANGSETAYTYYVKETIDSTFVFDSATLGGTTIDPSNYVEIGGEKYIKVDVSSGSEDYAVKLINYKKAIPVQIVKRDQNGGMTISGCEFTIYDSNGNVALDARTLDTDDKLENLGYTNNSAGVYVYLEPGKTYTYKETKEANSHFLSADSDNPLVQVDKGGVIITPTFTPGQTMTIKTYVVKNQVHPTIRIYKRNSASTSTTNVAGAKYSVYTRSGEAPNYTYTPVLASNGQPLVLNANGNASTERLTPGTYYFTESTVPANFLNPNYEHSAEVYEALDTTNTYIYESSVGTHGTTFIECEVGANTARQDFTFYNVPLTGNVKIEKWLNGTKFNQAGFQIQLNNGSTTVKQNVTGGNGEVTFTGVPVFNTDTSSPSTYGTYITYTVNEGPASNWTGGESGTLAQNYYLVEDGQSVQLIPAANTTTKIQTKDIDGATLRVNNSTYINISATKFQFDGFQFGQGGLLSRMDGVTIGLYRRVAGSGDWTAVTDTNGNPVTAVTVNGVVNFDGLEREVTPRTDPAQNYEYALVEIATGDENYFPWMQPESGKFADGFREVLPAGTETVTDSALRNTYNALFLAASDITVNKTDYDFNKTSETFNQDLYNSNHWVQFHITKWLDTIPGRSLNYIPMGSDEIVPLDDCIFTLYRAKLTDDDKNPDGSYTIEFDRGSRWESLNTYTSGSLMDADYHHLTGEFLTQVDTNVQENYVYVLIEESVGPNNAIMNPHFRYLFWCHEGWNVICTVVDEEMHLNGPIEMSSNYSVDMITYDNVLNDSPDGPGPGGIMLGALRLSKWLDNYNAAGNPAQEYEPLPNTFFELYLAGQTPHSDTPIASMIAYMTSDIGGQATHEPIAFAQSGVFQFIKNPTQEYPNAPVIIEYEVEGGTPRVYEVEYEELGTREVTEVEDGVEVTHTYTIYGVPVDLYEVQAPDGYGYYTSALRTYLCFANDGSTNKFKFFEDLYLVKDKDKTVALAEDQGDAREWNINDVDGNHNFMGQPIRRIVDMPMEFTPVDIHKVGYVPTKDTLGKDSFDIAMLPDSVHLQGVNMYLKRLDPEDGQFKRWDYTTNDWGEREFSTDIEGKYHFQNGLMMGTYRVYESSLGNVATGYENAYKESDGHYREFVVGGQGVIVYMANPKTVTLDITKYVYGDTSKTPVSGMTFKLTKAGSTNLSDVLTATQKDGENGVYYNFPSIPTGKYVLTETGNGSTVSSRYFAELFAQKYPDLAAMVGAGYDFGYTYGSKTIYEKIDGQDVAVGSDVTITAISPWEGTAETGSPILSLDVENPPLDELMVVKKDLDDDETNLSASFIVYYKPFTQITGSYTLDLPAAASTYAATKTNYDTIVNAERNDPKGWKRLSGKDFSSTPKNLTGLEPGVYVFLESATPSQYERVLDSSGKMLVYTAVVTGGLSVNVTVNPSQATVPGITDPVKTNFTKESGSMINVVARNRKMAPMYAKKSTLPARWNLDSPRLNWKVTLNVYDAQTGGTLLGSAVIDNSTNQNVNNGKGIQFTKDNQPVYFSVDKTYYLEEVIETAEAPAVDADHFIWTSLTVQPYTVNGAVGTPVNVDVTPGVRYPVAVSSSGGLTVTATNQYLYGEVTFIKYNGDQSDTVHGVTFVVETYNAETDKWETYAPASVEEIKNGETPTGRYRAFIPLDGPDPKTYRIREVRAPHGFVMDPDPTKRYIDVSLSAENNKVDYTNNPAPGQYLKNYPGSGLSVIKYRNIHSAVTKDQAYAPAGTAEFTLYHETTNGWVLEEGPVSVTGTQGEVKFTTTLYPGEKYAVVETWFRADSIDGTDFTGFNGLESMWVNGSEAVLGKITVNGTDIENAYVFTSDGATAIVIEAYNIPNLNPTLAKVDVGKFPQNVRANMGFKVFLVEDDFVADAASVKDLVDNISDTATGVPRVVFKGTTDLNYELQEPDETYLGTKKLWAGVDKIEDRWDPTKKYVLVEVEVGSTTESTYATMVKDDPRVTWFKVIEPVSSPTQAYLDENPYVLKNINGVANVTIEKNVIEKVEEPYNDSDVVNGKVESLLEGSRKVAYTLKPNVTGMGQMLTSFILTENGLIRNGTAESPVYDDSIPDYTIDKVLVGGASQVIPTAFGYTGAQPPEIKAIVTFDNGDSETVTFSVPYLLSETIEVVPEHTGAKSFTVEYYCEYVMDKTEDETTGEPAYKLGEEFRVGTSTVYMTIKKAAPGQPNGGNPGGQAPGTDLAKEILKFTNRTEAALSYPEWDKYGVKAAQPTTKSAYDTAEVEVKKVVLPTVSIQKSAALAEGQTVVETNSTLNYTIKIKNTSSTEKFEDPVVLDILPTGVTYQSGQTPSVTPDGIIRGIEVVPKIGVATRQIEKRDEQGNIIPGEYYSDAETAVIFKMSGTLEPQQEITLTFTVLVGESALIYATAGGSVLLTNDAYLTSAVHKQYYTADNPWGYSFKANDTDFGDTLANTAADLATTENDDALIHLQGVEGELIGSETRPYDDYSNGANTYYYEFIGAQDTTPVVEGESLTLVKAVRGDRDTDFLEREGDLGIASRTKDAEHSAYGPVTGYVDWRLTVNNGYQENRDHLVIGDVLPKVGDDPAQRASKWNVVFDHIEAIQVGNTILNEGADKDYVVYYYEGDDESDIILESQLTTVMKSIRTTVPDKWKTVMPDNKENITAFIIVFRADFTLYQGQSMMILYHTLVHDYSDPDDFFTYRAFENASNRFYGYYTNDLDTTVKSNVVGVTLMDDLVKIEGDVWIDEDWNSRQKAPSGDSWANWARRDYSRYQIIKDLANDIVFNIADLRSAAGGASSPEDAFTGMTGFETRTKNTDPGYGESIRHFVFSDLLPGLVINSNGLYDLTNEEIVPAKHLKGKDPALYRITATINDTNLLTVFHLTDPGDGTYFISADANADPGYVLTKDSQHSLDSNFIANRGVSYSTKAFYIPYAADTDQSKDIGFRMTRSLTINKVAQDDESIKIKGAKFKMYGPFEEGQGTGVSGTALWFSGSDGSYAWVFEPEDTTGLVQELVTDANGQINVTGLNWWKEYVIEETEAAPGYDKAGAIVTPSDVPVDGWTDGEGNEDYAEVVDLGNGVFQLKTPATERTADTSTHVVTVKNPRYVEIPLQVEKFLYTASTKEYTFDYELRLTDITPDALEGLEPNKTLLTQDPIQSVTLTVPAGDPNADGYRKATEKFANVKVNGAGTYTFSIKEIAPDPLPDGWTYDDPDTWPGLVKTATVVVKWRDADPANNIDAGLYVDSIVYSDPVIEGEGENAQAFEKFTNSYEAAGRFTPEVKKVMEGRPLVAGEFTFQWKDAQGNVIATGTNAADGTVTFTNKVSTDARYTVDTVNGLVYANYTLADVSTAPVAYTIVEVAPATPNADDGTTYTSAPVNVSVALTDNNNGTITAVGTYDPADKEFINDFSASGKWAPPVYKILRGRDFLPNETFTVYVKDSTGKTVLTGTATAGTDGQSAAVTFSNPEKITYTQDDLDFVTNPTDGKVEFTYTVVEQIPATNPSDGVHFDEHSYTVKVTVRMVKNADGTYSKNLEVKDDLEDPITFINDYTTGPTTHTPNVTKTISGEKTVKDMIFEFKLKADTVVPEGAFQPADAAAAIVGGENGTEWTKTVTVPAGESVKTVEFDTITYKIDGTYKYTITETIYEVGDDGFESGIVYSQAVWEYTVVVTDNLDGTMTATGSYAKIKADDGSAYTPGENDPAPTSAEFINTYIPAPTDYTPKVTKIIETLFGPTVEDKIFDFVLEEVSQTDPAGNTMTGGYTIDKHNTNTGTAYEQTDVDGDKTQVVVLKGQITAEELFGKIHFTKAGTYVFKATEVEPAAADQEEGIEYDKTEWTLTIVIVDTANELVVKSYSYAAPAKAATDPAEGADPAGDPTAPVVRESSEAVFDQTTGKVVTNVAETQTGFEYTNPYKPEPTDYTPMVTKIIETLFGPTVEDKIFDFILEEVSQKDASGADMTGGYTIAKHDTNTGTAYEQTDVDGDKTQVVVLKGQITAAEFFGKITFTKAGTYVFKASEVKPAEADQEEGITYDESVWMLKIVVVDTDHELVIASYAYYGPEDNTTDPTTDPTDPTTDPTDPTTDPTDPTTDPTDPTTDPTDPTTDPTDPTTDPTDPTTDPTDPTTDPTDPTTDPTDPTTDPTDPTTDPTDPEDTDEFEGLVVRESSEAVFDETTGKVVTEVEDTETGFEYTNPYKPEPTEYTPKVVKVVEGEPTVEEKTFYFEIEEVSQVDAAGDPMKDGYTIADHEVDGETLPGTETQITVPAGAINTVFEEFFGKITFEKAGTYTFKITESEGDLPGITYDDSEWILQIVIVDTDNELEVASWAYYGPAADSDPTTTDPTTDPTDPTTDPTDPTTDPTDPTTDPTDPTTDPTDPTTDPTDPTTDPTDPTTDPTDPTTDPTDPTTDPTDPTTDPTDPTTDPTDPTDDPTDPTEGLVLIEHSEAVFDEDTGKLVTPVEEAEFGAEFINTYIPAPAYGHPEVKKTLSGQDPVEDTTFEFVLEAVSVVEDGSFIDGEDVAVVAKDTWTKTITVPAGEKVGTVAFDEFKYVKAGTYVYSITETDSGKTGWTYSAKIWTITVTVTDTDGQLEFDIDYKAEDISSTIAEFINDYKPVPVDWFAQVQKLVAPSEDEDSKPNEEEAAFHFEFKLISADPKEGCLLTDTLTAETILLPAAEESDVVAFDTITFFAAGTYVFEVRELDEGLKNFSYDTDPRTITVKVIDNKGYLKVESVAINGGDAEIDGTKITVKVVNAYVPDTGDNSSLVLWSVALAASIVALCAVVFVRRRREEA